MNDGPEKVGLFVCHDLVGLAYLNGIVPGLLQRGVQPVIFNTGDKRNRDFIVPSPPMVRFFNVDLLRDTVIPYLESRSPIQTRDGQPVSSLAYTYRHLTNFEGPGGIQPEYHEIDDVNDPAFLDRLREDPQLSRGYLLRFLQICESGIVDAFQEKGGYLLNIHGGHTPNYKGLLTPYRAIANGEKTFGLTMHHVVASGIDTGNMVAQSARPLDAHRPVLETYLETVADGVAMALEALDRHRAEDPLPGTEQRGGRYYKNPTADEFRRFTAMGITYADPQKVPCQLSAMFSVAGTPHAAGLSRAVSAPDRHVRPYTHAAHSS